LRVALFVPCYVDLIRPEVGVSVVRVLRRLGVDVVYPEGQTCCGQPAFNSGDRSTTKRLALQMIDAFSGFDFVVVPSGSCGGMIAKHYPELFADDPNLAARAGAVAAKTYELVSFLTDILGVTRVDARFAGTVTYHDSCSGLRELGVRDQPRRLLASVEGLTLVELRDADVCCGFGGTFAVKYPDISNAIVEKKSSAIEETGATTLLAGDLGCLMNMAGKLSRRGANVEARHVAEVLAGVTDDPPIGIGAE
jgi:L-lactate dehydrogenase complex protein LldE